MEKSVYRFLYKWNVAITDFDMKLDQNNITFSSFEVRSV